MGEKDETMTKLLKTFAEGRRCQHPGCNRLLSIYNQGPYCRVHQEEQAEARYQKHYLHPKK